MNKTTQQADKKTCNRCRKRKPATEEFFHPEPRNLTDGFRAECIACRREADAESARRRRAQKKEAKLASFITQANEVIDSVQLPANEVPLPKKKRRAQPELPPSTIEATVKVGIVKTIVMLPDVHVPDHDPFVWEVTMQWIRDNQPDEIIIMGDFLELKSCSQHGDVDVPSLEQDFVQGRAAIRQLREAAPEAAITYLEGNHETRLMRFLAAKAPSLLDSLSVSAGLRLEEQDIVYVPEDQQPIFRGNLDILHGHQLSPKGTLPKHHAAKVCDDWAAPGRKAIIGHSHRQGLFERSGGSRGNRTGIALGAMRDLRVPWMHGHDPGWSNQFGIAYVRPGDVTDVYPVTIRNGAFAWNGRLYVATR